MTPPFRIAVADDEPDMRDYFQKILPRLGHQVVGAAENGAELVELCRRARPDLVITDIKMPDMDGIDAAIAIYRDEPTPVILVSAYHDPELIDRAEADHIMAYLVKPIKQADLGPVIALVVRRFESRSTPSSAETHISVVFSSGCTTDLQRSAPASRAPLCGSTPASRAAQARLGRVIIRNPLSLYDLRPAASAEARPRHGLCPGHGAPEPRNARGATHAPLPSHPAGGRDDRRARTAPGVRPREAGGWP